MSHYPALTSAEQAELQQFAAKEGRNWKAVLQRKSWSRGAPVHGFPSLYGVVCGRGRNPTLS